MEHFSSLESALREHGFSHLEKIRSAYEFAKKAHHGQMRKTGEEYITHPVAIARHLLDFGADEETIISALLHDTIEDTKLSLADIEREFGANVARIVDGLTKFGQHDFPESNTLDAKIETIRKWLGAVKDDLRIAVIKMLDRIDNLASLGVFRREKQIRIAQETLDIYTKIAEWLSLQDIRHSLERAALPFILSEEDFENLTQEEQKRNGKAKKISTEIARIFSRKEPRKNAKFGACPFSLVDSYSLLQQKHSLNEAFVPVIHCLVERAEECYSMLSFLHTNWRRKKGSFEDFINTPRLSGYRALHTALFLENGEEVQIRIMTHQMFAFHRNGITEFCFDPLKKTKSLPWVSRIEELLKISKEKSLEFWSGVESDLLTNFIVVYGPKDEVISLPQKSTYLDAAFAFLKEKAGFVESISGISGSIPFQRQIHDGEKIDFLFSQKSQVSYDWIRCVDNATSIRTIKEALREKKSSEKERIGRELLQEEFDRHGLGLVEEVNEEKLLLLCQDLEILSLSELLRKIGEVYIFPSEVVSRLAPQKTEKNEGKKKKYTLFCEVKRRVLPDFSVLLSAFVDSAKISRVKNKSDTFFAEISLFAPEEKGMALVRDIRRAPNMRVIKLIARESSFRLISWAIILFLSTLWGVGLVVADFFIESQHISPLLFSASRLWTVSFLMGVVFFLQSRHSQDLSKRINISHWSFYASALCFTGIPLFTYLALAYASPSQYVLLMLTQFVFAFFALIIERRTVDVRYLIPILLSLGIGYFFLFWGNSNFSLMGKLFIFLSVLSFGGYSYSSSYYARKLGVRARFPKFLFTIAIIGATICTLLYAFFVREIPTLNNLLHTVLYSVFFPGVAYFLYYILIMREGYSSMVGYSFFLYLAVTYTFQTLFLSTPIFLSEWLSLPFFGISVFLAARYFDKTEKKE